LTKIKSTSQIDSISTKISVKISLFGVDPSAAGGQKGQKGQILKNVPNRPKRIHNRKPPQNSTRKHVFSSFSVILMLY